jgi:hypothetical protein
MAVENVEGEAKAEGKNRRKTRTLKDQGCGT